MTDLSAIDQRAEPALATSAAEVADFVALMKPRVMSLVVFTALVGLLLAPGHLHPVLGFAALICIAVGAGAAGALNMWYDADIDAVMTRTCRRPIPAGRMLPGEALGFGATVAVGSVIMLGLTANWFAAGLLAFTIFFYLVIYTVWLKRSTPQNIVIGGAAGAFPPMIGWAAASGGVALESVLLFLIIFLWTPPHFWALSLLRSGDYARAGIPMLPVVAGRAETRRQILLYTGVLVPVSLAPWLLGFAGAVYGIGAVAAGALLAVLAYRVWAAPEGRPTDVAARRLFGFSILYLFALFAGLLVDRAFLIGGAMDERPSDKGIVLTEEQKRRRRARSIAIAVTLAALVLLVYIITIVKLGPGAVQRPH